MAAWVRQDQRDRAVLEDLLVGRPADERASMPDRQDVDDEVGEDQRRRDEREPIGRDVVLDREHARG